MKIYSLSGQVIEDAALIREHGSARQIGVLRIAESGLFFRSGIKHYYIPYGDIRRAFRRVMMVPARMCCGRGELSVESLVVCGEDGELAQIQLPGERAAKAAMEELKTRLPGVPLTCPNPSAPVAVGTV